MLAFLVVPWRGSFDHVVRALPLGAVLVVKTSPPPYVHAVKSSPPPYVQEAKPDNAALYAKFSEAQKKHVAGELDAARALMREVLDADPKNFELALSITRWLCEQRNDYAGAEPFARRAVELEPNSVEAVNFFGGALIFSSRNAEAEALYRAAIERFPAEGRMHYGLAMASGQQKKYLEAKAAYAKAIALDPSKGLYHFSAGENLSNLREYDAAEREFLLALKLDGHDDAGWRLGEMLAKQGKDAEAEAVLLRALNQGARASRWNAGLQLGILYFERGRASDAAAFLFKATELKPDARDAWMWLARAQRALGKEDAAQRSIRKYQELRLKDDKSEERRLLSLIRPQLEGRKPDPEPTANDRPEPPADEPPPRDGEDRRDGDDHPESAPSEPQASAPADDPATALAGADSASAAREESSDLERQIMLAELAAETPDNIAWGAWHAAARNAADLGPQILAALERVNASFVPPDGALEDFSEEELAWLYAGWSLLDAAVRLDLVVEPPLLAPWLRRKLRTIDAVLVLAARSPASCTELLLDRFDEKLDEDQWRAYCNLLIRTAPTRFMRRVVGSLELLVVVCVVDDGPDRPPHVAGGIACGMARLRADPRFPPLRLIEVTYDECGSVPFLDGLEPCFWRESRTLDAHNGEIRILFCNTAYADPREYSLPCIAAALDLPTDLVRLVPRRVLTVSWSDDDAVRSHFRTIREEHLARWYVLRDTLVARGVLSAAEAASTPSPFRWHVLDGRDRDARNSPLPPFPDEQ